MKDSTPDSKVEALRVWVGRPSEYHTDELAVSVEKWTAAVSMI